MTSQKTFAEGVKDAFELYEFFSNKYGGVYPCRAVLMRQGTDDRIAPEEILGKATITVDVHGLTIKFAPDDPQHATFVVGDIEYTEPISADVALLGFDSEDVVFRQPHAAALKVKPGDLVSVVVPPSDL